MVKANIVFEASSNQNGPSYIATVTAIEPASWLTETTFQLDDTGRDSSFRQLDAFASGHGVAATPRAFACDLPSSCFGAPAMGDAFGAAQRRRDAVLVALHKLYPNG